MTSGRKSLRPSNAKVPPVRSVKFKGQIRTRLIRRDSDSKDINVDYPMVCMNLTTGDMSTVGHRLIVQPGTATISATQTLSGNGKQINGWTLTGGAASGFTPSGNAVVRDTGCEGGALVLNTGTPSQPLTVTATGGGVSMQGMNKSGAIVTVPLADTTPVVVPAA